MKIDLSRIHELTREIQIDLDAFEKGGPGDLDPINDRLHASAYKLFEALRSLKPDTSRAVVQRLSALLAWEGIPAPECERAVAVILRSSPVISSLEQAISQLEQLAQQRQLGNVPLAVKTFLGSTETFIHRIEKFK